jgi:predicted esterase
MEYRKLTVSKTAHYCRLGQPGMHVRQLWLVCHGYAQLAAAFLENFRLLDDGHSLVLAPEGMNHFYQKGFSGPVVANWMTRHHREDAIADYSLYLQMLYDRYLEQIPYDARIVLLGFSQGTATVCRWALRNHPHFHDLILWAGMPPEDLDYAAHRNYLSDKNLYLIYGTSDPFLTPDRFSLLQEIEDKNGVDFEEKTFDGGHEIPSETLRQVMLNLT